MSCIEKIGIFLLVIIIAIPSVFGEELIPDEKTYGKEIIDKIQWTFFSDAQGVSYKVPYSWKVRVARSNDLQNTKELTPKILNGGIRMDSPDGYFSAVIVVADPPGVLTIGEPILMEVASGLKISKEYSYDFDSATYFEETNTLNIPIIRTPDDGMVRMAVLVSNYDKCVFGYSVIDPLIDTFDLMDDQQIFIHTIESVLISDQI